VVNVYLRNQSTELEYKVIAAANQHIRPVFHAATQAAISNFIFTNRSLISSLKPEEFQALKKLPGVRTEDRPSNDLRAAIVEKFAEYNLSDLSPFLLQAIEFEDGERLADFAVIIEDAMDQASDAQKAIFFHQLLAIEPMNFFVGAVMGMCRYSGMGDMKLSEEIHASARQGNSDAQVKLGYCYENGLGVIRNEETAIELYRLSAKQGNGYGQHSLGYCYEMGFGTPKDLNEAIGFYRLSAAQGLVIAQNALARLGV